MEFLSLFKGIVDISTPSMLILPDFSSINRNKAFPIELFPDPVLPMMPNTNIPENVLIFDGRS